MNTSKFHKVIIFVLLAANLGLITFLWLMRPPGPQGGPGRYLEETLKLDADQKEAYRKIREAHQQKNAEFMRAQSDRHQRLFQLLAAPALDSVRMMAVADSIAMAQKSMELYTFEHFRALRAICRPEQQSKFDQIIVEATKRMGPPPPPRR
ncbi:MAG: periplasmic heavy metal sensor [Bacteroidetes bacterium]|nr:periplasmic heavy metal sensor [Bacteroidota bacterium]